MAETFHWTETAGRLRALGRRYPLALGASGRSFVAPGPGGEVAVRFVPPAIQPIEGRSPREYLAALPARPGRQLVILVQAGGAALGLWQDDDLVRHKVIKKYVVRGRGRAQPTHLKTKGKSRYGSRLRLRNARALLREVNQRLCAWWREAPADHVLYGCPVRTWAELRRADPPPPFAKEAARKIPLDVHVPSFRELRRVRRLLATGRIERP